MFAIIHTIFDDATQRNVWAIATDKTFHTWKQANAWATRHLGPRRHVQPVRLIDREYFIPPAMPDLPPMF